MTMNGTPGLHSNLDLTKMTKAELLVVCVEAVQLRNLCEVALNSMTPTMTPEEIEQLDEDVVQHLNGAFVDWLFVVTEVMTEEQLADVKARYLKARARSARRIEIIEEMTARSTAS